MPPPPPYARNVVLVDDDSALRLALIFMLELEGFAVTAHDSGEALLLATLPPAPVCLVLDQNMSVIEGSLGMLPEPEPACPADHQQPAPRNPRRGRRPGGRDRRETSSGRLPQRGDQRSADDLAPGLNGTRFARPARAVTLNLEAQSALECRPASGAK